MCLRHQEDDIQNAQQPLRVFGDALWPHNCASDIPILDERGTCALSPLVRSCVLRRYPDLQHVMVIAPSTSSHHLYHAPRPQALFQEVEVLLWGYFGRLSGPRCVGPWRCHGHLQGASRG